MGKYTIYKNGEKNYRVAIVKGMNDTKITVFTIILKWLP